MKTIRYLIEALICLILFGIFKIMPVQWASGFGGFLGRSIGPHLASSRKAMRNLQRAFPDMDDQKHKNIIIGMWDNLGRVFAEYPHLKTIAQKYLTIENSELFDKTMRDNNGAVFIAGHIGNWELWSALTQVHFDADLDITYRAPNNPYIDKILHRARNIDGRVNAHPKSRESGRKIMQVLKNKGLLAIMIDQKYNEGVRAPFFGSDAMTNPVAFNLAQRFECPLIPTSCVRHKGARFTVKFHPPIPTHNEDETKRSLDDMMIDANSLLETWITDHPEQWIWLHKRWDSQALKTKSRKNDR